MAIGESVSPFSLQVSISYEVFVIVYFSFAAYFNHLSLSDYVSYMCFMILLSPENTSMCKAPLPGTGDT